MPSRRKVLILDDNQNKQRAFTRILRGTVNVLSAFTYEGAESLIRQNLDAAIIMVDACMPRGGREVHGPVTVPLVEGLSRDQSFKGRLIAISANFNRELLQAGCHRALSEGEQRDPEAVLTAVHEEIALVQTDGGG